MRPIERHVRRPAMTRILRATTLAGALLATAAGCSGSGRAPKPVASLAKTEKAQIEIQAILELWGRSSREQRMALKPRLEAFKRLHGAEPPALTADALLAWVIMEEGAFARAETLASVVQVRTKAGTTNDVARTIQGAALRRRGEPDAALRLLTPLVSKLIDPWARALLNEEIVQSALAAKQWQRALQLMSVWLREASPRTATA